MSKKVENRLRSLLGQIEAINNQPLSTKFAFLLAILECFPQVHATEYAHLNDNGIVATGAFKLIIEQLFDKELLEEGQSLFERGDDLSWAYGPTYDWVRYAFKKSMEDSEKHLQKILDHMNSRKDIIGI